MKEQADALLKALAADGCDGARKLMPDLLAAIQPPLDERSTRAVLEALRGRRCFEVLHSFATHAAKIAVKPFAVHVKRQLAQAKVELGLLDEAATLLDALVLDMGDASFGVEWSEVNGLRGRTHKQRFVQAVAGGESGQEELRAAVSGYSQVFEKDPAWHGANIVALVARAERDGFDAQSESARRWADLLLDRLSEKPRVQWTPWDYASAGEAYLALEDQENVADCFAHYWSMPNTDAFALGGTARQLREIWQITGESPDTFKASLLLHLEARKLTAAKGGAKYTAADLQKLETQLRQASGRAEATFGAGSAMPLERVLALLNRARSICRISDLDEPEKSGTGFLVNGSEFDPPLDGVFVLTNHHVVHGDEASADLLATPDYAGSIHVSRAVADFHYWDGKPEPHRLKLGTVLRYLIRPEGDFTLASLTAPVSADAALPLSKVPKPLGSRNIVDPKQRKKVFIVGHPKGKELSFSLSDNEVLDHELDDNRYSAPRRIHYRTPTEPGSSGSPVFYGATMEVVGLHRTGRANPLRDDWPRAKPDEVYEGNEAVSVRSILGV
jgi:hypothetical protein